MKCNWPTMVVKEKRTWQVHVYSRGGPILGYVILELGTIRFYIHSGQGVATPSWHWLRVRYRSETTCLEFHSYIQRQFNLHVLLLKISLNFYGIQIVSLCMDTSAWIIILFHRIFINRCSVQERTWFYRICDAGYIIHCILLRVSMIWILYKTYLYRNAKNYK